MKLCGYARNEWLAIILVGLLLIASAIALGWWPLAVLIAAAVAAVLTFFRDPERRVPTQRGAIVAPADGRVSSIHELDHFPPFDGPAVCIRIFMSVFDVHLNRSPCHGIVKSITHTPGDHRNTLNPESAEVNENNLIVMSHPVRDEPVAAVRQIAGLLARTIYCHPKVGVTLQRGQRIGIIKLGSTTELYLPAASEPTLSVEQGQKVQGGLTVVAQVKSKDALTAVSTAPPPKPAQKTATPSTEQAPAPARTTATP